MYWCWRAFHDTRAAVQGMVEDLTEECKKHSNIVDIRVPHTGTTAEAVLGKGCYSWVILQYHRHCRCCWCWEGVS
jgi:hypothetical protein